MFSSKTSACNVICVILMIALFICQCVPFWHFGETGEEQSASINGYVWFPSEHSDLEKYLKTVNEEHTINSVVLMPVFQLIFFAAGLVLTLFKHESSWIAIFPAASGLLGLWGYLSKPVFQAGSLWPLHLTLCVLMLLAAVVCMIPSKKAANA